MLVVTGTTVIGQKRSLMPDYFFQPQKAQSYAEVY